MIPSHSISAVLWTVSAIQAIGILSVLLARLTEGSCMQNVCRALFIISLTLVGTTAIVTMLITPELWLISGITFSGMIILVLFEHKDPKQASVW
ncbi:MAG: hypothetical protein PVH19_09720 [Planctomycetia bacterium]|jgi:hypothetical protein